MRSAIIFAIYLIIRYIGDQHISHIKIAVLVFLVMDVIDIIVSMKSKKVIHNHYGGKALVKSVIEKC